MHSSNAIGMVHREYVSYINFSEIRVGICQLTLNLTGQWLWLSSQNGRFQHQRSAVRIQSSTKSKELYLKDEK